MRLEPVYLVAPRERAPVMATRRAFLGMGLAFTAGTLVGGACGYSLARQQSGSAGTTAGGDPVPPSGDAELDELRRLAVVAPIQELLDQRLLFLMMRERTYAQDPVLWRGVARLTEHVITTADVVDRGQLARLLIATITKGAPPAELSLAERVPALREIPR